MNLAESLGLVGGVLAEELRRLLRITDMLRLLLREVLAELLKGVYTLRRP
jgi:hypothetical protein